VICTWEQILVLHSHGIQHTIVLHQSEFAILLLLNKEDWHYGGFGWLDLTRIEVLFKEGIFCSEMESK